MSEERAITTTNGKQVATTSQAMAAYVDSLDVQVMGRIKAFAPWANNKDYPMDNGEFSLTIRRAIGMGVDPFNPHEIQIWKDRQGVHMQLAYTLVVEWVREFKGQHTEPEYRQLDKGELLAAGLKENDHAVECNFMMLADIPNLTSLIAAKFEPMEARRMVTIRGMASASAEDWASKYFAPNGRAPVWKLEKRAFVDAVRRRFGTPTAAEIYQLRQARGQDNITPEDWANAYETVEQVKGNGGTFIGGDAEAAESLAGMTAESREIKGRMDSMTPEQQQAKLAENVALLRGDHDEDDPFGMDSKPEPQPEQLPDEPEGDDFPPRPAALGRILESGRYINEALESVVLDPEGRKYLGQCLPGMSAGPLRDDIEQALEWARTSNQ